MPLTDGARIAVVGGGPSGSFLSFFLLNMAEMSGLEISVDIYEPRSFAEGGPAGCNHCGGIVSESLVQTLATEGINLPPTVVQRGIESYVLHMDVGSVTIGSPVDEQRIASVYRGNGPRGGEDMPWESFDGYLQQLTAQRGARLIRKLVSGIEWREGFPHLQFVDGESGPYDFVAIASGVNSNLYQKLNGQPANGRRDQYRSLTTARTYICEFHSDRETIRAVMGNSMHVFLLDLPGLEFAALIPKGDYITLAMLGHDIDPELIREFLDTPAVRRSLPFDEIPCVCSCTPLINVKGPSHTFADRLVMIGDTGVTRLYKDGIGAAYRTAKAAAVTAILHGVSADDFRRHYEPVCRSIGTDNKFGKFLFAFTWLFRKVRFTRRAVLRMTAREQESENGTRRMSRVLWNLFTGSAPYREVFYDTIHPVFVGGLAKNLVLSVAPGRGGEERDGA
jgi:flavin-dependent dehydrogenase